MLLVRLVEASEDVAGTSKRLTKIGHLAALLKELRAEEVEIAVAFLSGSTRQGRIGIGYSTLREANAPSAVEPMLELRELDRWLEEFAAVSGRGSVQRRVEMLRGLMARATDKEQRFLRALLLGELRQGALEGIMLEAIARASGIQTEQVRRAAMVAGNMAEVARAALEQGEPGLSKYDVRLFCPLQPMLAQSAEDVAEAIDELGEAALEYKMDGARIQVHKNGSDVVVFSRALNDVTAAVPEVVEVARALPAQSVILDGEVIGLQPDGRPQPFQVTMRRFGRKLDVESMRHELPLTPFWFDLLFADGGSLLNASQATRFEALAKMAPAESLIPNLRTAKSNEADDFLRQAIAHGHEGIMAKDPAAAYAAGARGASWLKVKQARTLDLVILAAEWGNGRRHGWLSNLHLGARDAEKGGFAMLGKTFKGLTDEMLTWQTQELLKIEIARDEYTVYVEPKIVVEIAFNEIQASTRYVSGLALRFARVKRYRTDKAASESDTFQTVKRLASFT